MTTEAASPDREWFLRALLVLQAPRPVFAALRDDSDESAHARQEPVLALIWLAGIAGVLATSVARTLLDDSANHPGVPFIDLRRTDNAIVAP